MGRQHLFYIFFLQYSPCEWDVLACLLFSGTGVYSVMREFYRALLLN